MGQHVSRDDFEWTYTEEPHRTRRIQILAKYPAVKKLMVSDPNLKWAVLGMVIVQLAAAWFLRDASYPLILIAGYCFGGVLNHSMTLAIHEISHNLAFGNSRPVMNKLLGIFGNLPLGIPYSVTFKKYHLEHHKFQGQEGIDMDIPSSIEAKLFTNSFTKFIWLLLQPFFYALRPILIRPKALNMFDLLNYVVQFTFDFVVLYVLGFRSLFYLVCGTFLSLGLHPVAGHFISEHYMFKKGYETYSYYGPLNMITFNVGYHNEHHDFPNIPGCLLPQLKALAPEYYENLPSHSSWVRVLYDFVMDPEIGPYARVKRHPIPFPGEEDKTN